MARRQRQPTLPAEGMGRVQRPEIEEPAEDLRAVSGEIATLNERKRALKASLRQALESAGLSAHKYLDPEGVSRVAKIKDKPGVSVDRDKSAKKDDTVEVPDGDGGDEPS